MRDFTPAGFLLLRSLLSGSMSYEEKGKRVYAERVSGETFLFFRTDEAGFREVFGLDKQGAKASDVMALYVCKDKGCHRIFFVELKGENYDKALEQLAQLISVVKEKLSQSLGRGLFEQGEPIAVIVSDRSAPRDFKDASVAFFKRTKVKVMTASKGSADLRSFLDEDRGRDRRGRSR